MNDAMEHDTYRLWLDLDVEGELGPLESSELRRHLATCASCCEERRALEHLGQALAASRVPARDDLKDRVMASLPAAGWEARHPRSWAVAMVLLALLASASAFLVARGDPTGTVGSAAGILAALFDLFATSTVTGSGLLTASWRGVGMAVQDLVSGSPGGLAVLGIGVLSLNLLFFSLLRGTVRRLGAVRARDRR